MEDAHSMSETCRFRIVDSVADYESRVAEITRSLDFELPEAGCSRKRHFTCEASFKEEAWSLSNVIFVKEKQLGIYKVVLVGIVICV